MGLPDDPRVPLQIAAERLVVDENYQRAITDRRRSELLTIGEHWRWELAEVPTVVPIDGGMFRVTEGQGRVWIVRHIDRGARLWCMVLPPELVGRACEADIALGISTARKGHTALEQWLLRVARGDAHELAAEDVLAMHGLRLAAYASAHTISAVATVRKIVHQRQQTADEGAELLDRVLRVLLAAWPDYNREDNTARFDQVILTVLARVITLNPDIDESRLISILRNKAVKRWLNDAREQRERVTYVLGALIVKAYNYKRRGRLAMWTEAIADADLVTEDDDAEPDADAEADAS